MVGQMFLAFPRMRNPQFHVSVKRSMAELSWDQCNPSKHALTHWGRVTHICVSKLTIIGSDNGLSPGRRQAIIWTNAGILLIGPIRTNFNEIFIEINIISFKKIHLKMSSGKWRPSCLGLNVLICQCWSRNDPMLEASRWYCPSCGTL